MRDWETVMQQMLESPQGQSGQGEGGEESKQPYYIDGGGCHWMRN